ncbi:hypothetical protein Tco_0625902 [Tanacetum coccineum]|uniref:Uncharacterized protein n=1 Tax=Tanacetum coccineum TaxID=301880 RepID=A0ABQ4WI52_9ASTR
MRDEKKRLDHLKHDQTILVIKRFSKRKKVFRERKKTEKIRAKRAIENDDVLGANGGGSMRVDTYVQLAHEQPTSNVAGMSDEDSDNEVEDDYDDNPYNDDDDCEDFTKEQLAICDKFDIKICGHTRRSKFQRVVFISFGFGILMIDLVWSTNDAFVSRNYRSLLIPLQCDNGDHFEGFHLLESNLND